CLEGTRVQVLSDIDQWTQNPGNSRVYWLNGMAGIGKTAIAESVARKLRTQNMLGASFFCSRSNIDRRDVKRLFSTIAYMLAQAYPAFAHGVLQALKNDPDMVSYNFKQQFEELIVKPASQMQYSTLKPIILVVIDAIDELDDGEAPECIFQLLCKYAPQLKSLYFFITGRPEVYRSVSKFFGTHFGTVIHLHNIEADIVTQDIQLYLRANLEKIPGLQNSILSTNGPYIIDELTLKAGKLFIYAFTVCQFINFKHANPKQRLMLVMDNIYPDSSESPLDQLYKQVLATVFDIPGQRPEESKVLQNSLQTMLLVYTPQSMTCIAQLLGYPPDDAHYLFEPFSAIVKIPDSINQPVTSFHASFFDFIINEKRAMDFAFVPAKHHAFLAKRCLIYLNMNLCENICQVVGRPLKSQIIVEIPSAMKYACIYWTRHLCAGESLDIDSEVNEFIGKHLLHWLECFSLLGDMKAAVEAIQQLIVYDMENHNLVNLSLVHDIHRFILEFMDMISVSPMEIYRSALLWTPYETQLHKTYYKQKEAKTEVVCGLKKVWKPTLRTILGH
ncbi:hypothetical protein PLICRDRAFT_67390, partial [Plicaturopsis crispa FD-325 SS-3]